MNQTHFWKSGIRSVLTTQFFSAFADNAILFALLINLKNQAFPEWSFSALQALFIIMFVLTAPFLGILAEAYPKNKILFLGNFIKLIGSLFLLFNGDIFIGYALIGLGAALYSPAKYGILGEIVSNNQLIKANGLIESSTVVAILLGSLAGGLISDINPFIGLIVCFILYFLATLFSLFLPKLKAIKPLLSFIKFPFIKHFYQDIKKAVLNQNARFILLGIFIFWGSAITLRFLLIHWIPIAFAIDDAKTPALFNAIVGVGIIIGSLIISQIHFSKLSFLFLFGILMGVCLMILMLQAHFYLSYFLLFAIGIFGGFLIVPLNAFLQSFGQSTIGAGNAIAIQNFGENTMMMIALGLYTLALASGISVTLIGLGFGFVVILLMFYLMFAARKLKINLGVNADE